MDPLSKEKIQTQLRRAVGGGRVANAAKAIERGADVNPGTWTPPLLEAIFYEHPEVLQLLIDSGAVLFTKGGIENAPAILRSAFSLARSPENPASVDGRAQCQEIFLRAFPREWILREGRGAMDRSLEIQRARYRAATLDESVNPSSSIAWLGAIASIFPQDYEAELLLREELATKAGRSSMWQYLLGDITLPDHILYRTEAVIPLHSIRDVGGGLLGRAWGDGAPPELRAGSSHAWIMEFLERQATDQPEAFSLCLPDFIRAISVTGLRNFLKHAADTPLGDILRRDHQRTGMIAAMEFDGKLTAWRPFAPDLNPKPMSAPEISSMLAHGKIGAYQEAFRRLEDPNAAFGPQGILPGVECVRNFATRDFDKLCRFLEKKGVDPTIKNQFGKSTIDMLLERRQPQAATAWMSRHEVSLLDKAIAPAPKNGRGRL